MLPGAVSCLWSSACQARFLNTWSCFLVSQVIRGGGGILPLAHYFFRCVLFYSVFVYRVPSGSVHRGEKSKSAACPLELLRGCSISVWVWGEGVSHRSLGHNWDLRIWRSLPCYHTHSSPGTGRPQPRVHMASSRCSVSPSRLPRCTPSSL